MTFLKVFTEAGRVLSAAPAFTDSLRRARQLFYYDDYEEKKKYGDSPLTHGTVMWLDSGSKKKTTTK